MRNIRFISFFLLPLLLFSLFPKRIDAVPTKPPEGDYLLGGLAGLVRFQSGRSPLSYGNRAFGQLMDVDYGNGILRMHFLSPDWGMGGYHMVFQLAPSFPSKKDTDWDLVAVTTPGREFQGEAAARQNMVKLIRPLPSFLHRVRDDRVLDYYRDLDLSSGDPKARIDWKKAEALHEPYPEDPFLRILYLDALMRQGKWDLLERKWSGWRSGLEKPDNPLLRFLSSTIDRGIRSKKSSEKHQNAHDYFMRYTRMKQGESFESIARKAVDCPESLPPPLPPTRQGDPIPNYLNLQICAKVLRVEATFAMITGDNKRALDLLRLTYELGHKVGGEGTLISNLIGVAVRGITLAGMELYLTNACRNPPEAEQFFHTLQNLRRKYASVKWDDYLQHQYPVYSLLPPEASRFQEKEVELRWYVLEARRNALLGAAAAWHAYLFSGIFPQENIQFGPLLPDGPPEDPFSDKSLQYLTRDDAFHVYSLGPDKTDNWAAFSYDPTNGTISSGDVIVEIPRNPRYPFPLSGKTGTTKEGILRQFPNGLPRDLFHDDYTGSLTVIDSIPPKIISFGPDTDSMRTRHGELLPLDPPYDPTNGIVSNGDLILELGP